MAAIQQALIKVLDSMLRQVQRTNQLDSAELSLSHAFSRSFDAAIKQQLDPIWNTLSHGTRALVRDMRTVQELLRFLLRFNAVSFLRYLQCLRAAAGPNTEWMLLAAANTVFQARRAARCLKPDNDALVS
jgi:DNA excision repair protein ERCC-4